MPCLNALFTPEDQDLVRNFGLTMSVTSLVFCTVALWVFLTQPDIATRRKSVVTGSTATNSTRNSGQGRPSVDGFNLRASIAEMGSSFHQFVERAKAGKLLAGHSKANRWKLVLFAGAWVNALYSMIYDIMDIQNPVGCRGEAIILRYQPFAVLKAAINFWVHFFVRAACLVALDWSPFGCSLIRCPTFHVRSPFSSWATLLETCTFLRLE